jgi:hypothetical protein
VFFTSIAEVVFLATGGNCPILEQIYSIESQGNAAWNFPDFFDGWFRTVTFVMALQRGMGPVDPCNATPLGLKIHNEAQPFKQR